MNSSPDGEISLSFIDRLMIDCFSLTFPRFFVVTKSPKNVKILNFYSLDLHFLLNSQVFLFGIEMGVNIVCTLLLTGKHNWDITLVAKCKIKSC